MISLNLQFANLCIEKIAIHQVFQKNEKNEVIEPKYNNQLTTLDEEGLCALGQRVIAAIGHDSHSIEMQVLNSDDGSTFQILSKMINCDDGQFLSLSKNLALRLAQSQTTRRIPGGIFLVFRGKVGARTEKCIGIIKAELHGGFNFTEDSDSMIVKYLSNLLLTPQQKLYKLAMFIRKADDGVNLTANNSNDYKVFVYDQTISRNESGDAAIYFYQTFLGCSVHKSSKKLTQDFFKLTQNFINDLDIDDDNKVNLSTALHTYLNVEMSNTIQVREFAERYIGDVEIVDKYTSFMIENDIPDNNIIKDVSGLERKLNKRKLKFSSNVSITAPSDKFSELVRIVSSEDNKTTIEIDGHIKSQG